MKLFRLAIFFLCFFSVSCLFAAQLTPCQRAERQVQQKRSGLLAIINIKTKAQQLYSTALQTSFDCKQYQPDFMVKHPDLAHGNSSLCMVLPAAEIQPARLKCLKAEICLSEKQCKTVIFDLTWSASQRKYIAAKPAVSELDFISDNKHSN